MPRAGQIIPEYLAPHVKTYINDNSTFTDTVSIPSEDGIRLLCVFTSSKGEDGVVKAFTNVTDFLEEYGNPNYNLHGQPVYMPYAALSNGNARCFCMRVMPEDKIQANYTPTNDLTVDFPVVAATNTNTAAKAAKYSAVMVFGLYKIDTTTKKFHLKFGSKSVSDVIGGNGLIDKSAIYATMQNYDTTVADEDGYFEVPLFTVNSKGRGIYGDSFSIRVVSDTRTNAENSYVNYIVEVLDSSSGTILKKEQFRGSFNDDAIVSNVSLYINDLVNDYPNGSGKVEFTCYADGFKALYDAYVATVPEGAVYAATVNADADDTNDDIDVSSVIYPYNQCDLLNGVTKTGIPLPQFVRESTTVNGVVTVAGDILDSTVGIQLRGGSDGCFAANYVPAGGEDTITRAQYIEAAYINAFRGLYDHDIKSKRCTPSELILDAGYPVEVKKELGALALNRYDALCVIDAGYITTLTQADYFARGVEGFTGLNFADRIIVKEPQHYKIRDPFSGRSIPVTTTYFLAENLPTHYTLYGNHIPFVGSNYAQLTNHIRNTIRPHIDADNLESKEVLYTNKCNYFECIGENNYVRAAQITSQNVWSDLSEENNIVVMLQMKRMLEEFIGRQLYNFSEAEDRVRFTADAERMFVDFRNTKVRSYEVYFDMNAFEEERSILHCYLSVVFRTLAKRGIIEIDINKRV